VFLLHVSVECRIRKISLLAILAFEVPTLIIVFRPPLANLPGRILVLILIIGVIGAIEIILTLLVLIVRISHLIVNCLSDVHNL
jgi:hypothetical protein